MSPLPLFRLTCCFPFGKSTSWPLQLPVYGTVRNYLGLDNFCILITFGNSNIKLDEFATTCISFSYHYNFIIRWGAGMQICEGGRGSKEHGMVQHLYGRTQCYLLITQMKAFMRLFNWPFITSVMLISQLAEANFNTAIFFPVAFRVRMGYNWKIY